MDANRVAVEGGGALTLPLDSIQGAELREEVDAALKSVNLFHGGVGDKPVRAWKGRRRS